MKTRRIREGIHASPSTSYIVEDTFERVREADQIDDMNVLAADLALVPDALQDAVRDVTESDKVAARAALKSAHQLLTAMTPEKVQQSISVALSMNSKQLLAVASDSLSPALNRAVSTILLRSIKSGDPKRFEYLLERCVGKVPVVIKPLDAAAKLTREERIRLAEDIVKLNPSVPYYSKTITEVNNLREKEFLKQYQDSEDE